MKLAETLTFQRQKHTGRDLLPEASSQKDRLRHDPVRNSKGRDGSTPRQTKRMKESPPKESGQESRWVDMPRPPSLMGADAKMGRTSSSRLNRNATTP